MVAPLPAGALGVLGRMLSGTLGMQTGMEVGGAVVVVMVGDNIKLSGVALGDLIACNAPDGDPSRRICLPTHLFLCV